MRDFVLRGAIIGGVTFIVISVVCIGAALVTKPSWTPAPLGFWWLSSVPVLAVIGWVAGDHSSIGSRGLLLCAVPVWVGAGAVIGSIVGRLKSRAKKA